MDSIEPATPLLHGCMQCKAQQPYTVERLPNRNTVWRCAVCRYVVNLVPGTYSAPEGLMAGEAPV